ncbi:helix-turn-helix domain-containing protein [Kiritimatiella glycovorans]|uniref:AraC family transcriptional regulator n=1 Tax=Kiritimatiella glycovorans TaxID=1307763 RepID=A0A0G3EFN7_9BACT|nr:AraC family transcriptional regulator [Kiritimatiella glycovorans]AKJ63615.1 AraC family transcriptional regulator [Kiritimatiella glycovorans]
MRGIAPERQITKRPNIPRAARRLASTGLAFEYFRAFSQSTHQYHTHPFVEVLFVLNGTFRHVTADRTYDETRGGVTILNYHQYHTLKTPRGPVELMNLYWDRRRYPAPPLPPSLDRRLHDLIPSHPMLGHRLNRVVHLQLAEPDRPLQLLAMLYAEQERPADGSETAIESLFRLLLIELCRAAPAVVPEHTESIDTPVERVRVYLDEHFNEAVPLDDLCAVARLRRANLCRRFKRYTGLTTGAYLRQRRLAEAVRRLRTTDDKIAVVCLESGFSDLSNFNRLFRQVFGCTPSAFRNEAEECTPLRVEGRR